MAYQEAYQEPYTKYPNRYSDVIKPQLTDTQRDICDVVIRMTCGWHQTSAEISNAMFAAKTGKTIQAIIKAKRQLEEMGLLVVLERGGGSKKGRYMLDLYYDDPEASVKASILRQEEQLVDMENASLTEEDIPELLETPATDNSSISEELQQEMEVPPVEEVEAPIELEIPAEEVDNQLSQEDIPESLNALATDESAISDELQREIELEPPVELEEDPTYEDDIAEPQPEMEVQPVESETPPSENHTPEESPLQSEISDTAEAENPGGVEGSDPTTTKLSLPPDINGINNILGKKRKQTLGPEAEKAEKKKNATATVRYKFLSIFPEARAEDDWAFFGWAASTYGLEACLEKLNYMIEHRKQHSITNPKGFFRFALERDYQPAKSIAAKIRADEQARREKERFQRESEEWDKMAANFNYESAMASVQKILDMLN